MAEAVLRLATDGDAIALWRIRNEDGVREASFDPQPIRLDDHRRWFGKRLGDASTRLYLVLDPAGGPVGFVRFDVAAGEAEISVALLPAARGRGLGRSAIRCGCLDVLSQPDGPERVVARVRPGNEASLRAFRGAGFRELGRTAEAVSLLCTLDDA